ERPAHRHALPDRLHVGGEPALGAGELLEGEAGHLGDHVVDRRLEGGGRRPRDVVRDLLERVADRELRGPLPGREAGRLGGERGAEARAAPVSISPPPPRPGPGLRATGWSAPPVSTPTARITRIAWSRSS